MGKQVVPPSSDLNIDSSTGGRMSGSSPRTGSESNVLSDAKGWFNKLWKYKLVQFIIFAVGLWSLVEVAKLIAGDVVSGLYQPWYIQYPAIILLTIFILVFVSAISNRAFGPSNRHIKKAVAWLVVFMAVAMFVKLIDHRNYDSHGNPTKWINIVNGKIIKDPNNEVLQDSTSAYFIDTKTGDTCRPASKELRDKIMSQTDISKKAIYRWTTVYNQEYDSTDATADGLVYTNLKYYSFQPGDRVVIENVDKNNEVVKVALNAQRTKWGYADNISGQYVVDIYTTSYSTAEGVVTLQIIGSGKARVKLERNVPIVNSQGNS